MPPRDRVEISATNKYGKLKIKNIFKQFELVRKYKWIKTSIAYEAKTPKTLKFPSKSIDDLNEASLILYPSSENLTNSYKKKVPKTIENPNNKRMKFKEIL